MLGNVTIEGIAYELAPHRISSAEIEAQLKDSMDRFGMQQGQLEHLTGIKERRFWDRGVQPSEVATIAAEKVLANAGIPRHEIGVIINSSVCKDYIEPSVACLVHGNLGLPETCLNFDVGNACLGFLNAMHIVDTLIESGQIKYGLIVDGEGARDPVEATIARLQSPDCTVEQFRANFATLTLGSGAVAMLLTHKKYSKTGHTLNDSVSLADTRHNRLCLGQPTEMLTDASALLRAGVSLAGRTWLQAMETIKDWRDQTIDLYIPHQVSIRHMQALGQTLGLSNEKIHLNVQTQGNIGPAALPITLAMAAEAGRMVKGAHVALMGIGSGLNCSMMSLTW